MKTSQVNPDLKESKHEVGFVVSAQDYLLYLEGLPSVHVNDVLISEKGGKALVSALEKDRIEAWMLDEERPSPGASFTISSKGIHLPLSDRLFGRTFNPLGVPLDGKGTLPPGGDKLNLDTVAGGIGTRDRITEQLYTGLTLIDTLLPLGKGQRELMFGEPRSGKSIFILDTILHQKNKNMVCIYTAIGLSEIDTKRFAQNLEKGGAFPYTIVIAATSNDAAPLIAIAPSVALSVAEFFRDQGRDVLLFLDDLGIHSKYLREIGLLSGRIPGRESYPADIFYAHSHLMERAGNFNDQNGKSSITLLPMIETDLENFTNLIPTNVMSMTDGHILFSAQLRAQGHYPAIETIRSVTRVGHQTQKPLQKNLADKIRQLLADYAELERYGRFGSELTMETQMTIKRGIVAEELLIQERGELIEPETQILLLSLVFTRFFDTRDIEFVKKNKSKIISTLQNNRVFNQIFKTSKNIPLEDLLKVLSDNLNILNETCG